MGRILRLLKRGMNFGFGELTADRLGIPYNDPDFNFDVDGNGNLVVDHVDSNNQWTFNPDGTLATNALEAGQLNNVKHISPDEDLTEVLEATAPSTNLVLEPNSTYQISGGVTVKQDNITIEGAGKESTTIEFSSATGDDMFLVGGSSSANYFTLRGVTLDCSNQSEPADFGVGDGTDEKSPGNAILFDNEGGVGVTGSVVENVRIENAANEAIAYFGSSVFATEFFATVRNCEIINPRFRGIHPHYDHTVAAINNIFRDCTKTWDALIRHSHIIVNNRFENCRPGLDGDNTAAYIIGSDFASVISGNTFEKCGNPDSADALEEAGIVAWDQDRDYVTDNTFVDCELPVCFSTNLLDRGEDRGGTGRFINNIILENDGGGVFADKDNSVINANWFEGVNFNDGGPGSDSRQRLIWVGGGAEGVQIDANWVIDGGGNEAAISVLDPGENYVKNNYFNTDGFAEFIDVPDESVVRDNSLFGRDSNGSGVLGAAGSSTNQTIPDSEWTQVEWNEVRAEDELLTDVNTTDNTVTVKQPGRYRITSYLRFESDVGWETGHRLFIGCGVNGDLPKRRISATKAGDSQQAISLPEVELTLSSGDSVDIQVFQDSGTDKEISLSVDPFWMEFSVRKVA